MKTNKKIRTRKQQQFNKTITQKRKQKQTIRKNKRNVARKNLRLQRLKANQIRQNIKNEEDKKIEELTQMIKKMQLGGGSMINPYYKPINITNNRAFSARELYCMGQNQSLIRTHNKVIYVNNYTSTTVSIGNDIGYLLWFPYFYPNYNNDYMINTEQDEQYVVDKACGLLRFYRGVLRPLPTTRIDMEGEYRLVSATMKVTNITANTNKGGCYTIYRLTNDTGTPFFYNSQHVNTNTSPMLDAIPPMMTANYDANPTKYLFNANEVAYADEYNIYEGNTIFQGWEEYMGMAYSHRSNYTDVSIMDFNPHGINVKYLVKIDGIAAEQTYKIETWQLYEIIPQQTSIIAASAKLQEHVVAPHVLTSLKKKFPIYRSD